MGRGRGIVVVVALVASVAALTFGFEATAHAQSAPGRLLTYAGADRVETAVAVSQGGFPFGAERVYLARADSFPDALAGASLGGGPVLLVPTTGLPPASVVNEVNRLDPSLVVAFGGPAVLSDLTVSLVAGGRPTHRLGGLDRFDTAVQISQFGFVGGSREVYLARGDDFADALAAGSLHDGPVLLVPRSGPVPAGVRSEIARLGPQHVLALGGEQAVPAAVLLDAAGGLPTGRLAGADRYTTAIAIAQHAYGPGVAVRPAVVSGANFPDGLAAGGLDKGPVLLVPPCGELPPAVDAELRARAPRSLALLGGPNAVCEGVVARVAAAAGVARSAGPFDETAVDPRNVTATTWAMPIRFAFGAGTEELPSWQGVVERAMATWEALGGIDFVPAGGGPVDLVIGFAQGCHVPDQYRHECFDGAGGVLAHATIGDVSPIQAALHFDDAHVWVDSTTPGPGQFDLETVALHELGHVLGLRHSPEPSAVMFDAYSGPRRQLTPDDVARIRQYYPAPP
jgi:putative cell wall-binding protein